MRAMLRIATDSEDLEGMLQRNKSQGFADFLLNIPKNFFLKFHDVTALSTDEMIVFRQFIRQFVSGASAKMMLYQNAAFRQQLQRGVHGCSRYVPAVLQHRLVQLIGSEMISSLQRG